MISSYQYTELDKVLYEIFVNTMILDENEKGFYKHLVSICKSENIKLTPPNMKRDGFHIRFPLAGNLSDFNKFFSKYGIEVSVSNESRSGTFPSYILQQKQPYKGANIGDSIIWVNKYTGAGSSVGAIFATKELTPNEMGISGKVLTLNDTVNIVWNYLERKYNDSEITDTILKILTSAYRDNKKVIKLPSDGGIQLGKKDLKTISKDFGEVLSAVWILGFPQFTKIEFPAASNEKLVDFYAIQPDGKRYSYSVKSGGGSKTSTEVVLDFYNKNPSSLNVKDKSSKILIDVLTILNKNDMKSGILELYKYFNLPEIKLVGNMMNMDSSSITVKDIDSFCKSRTKDEMKVLVQPLLKSLKTNLKDDTWSSKYENSPVRVILSPLGTKLPSFLNSVPGLNTSLSTLINQISVNQINCDVTNDTITFKVTSFTNAKFHFDWQGYSGGGKIGFKMG